MGDLKTAERTFLGVWVSSRCAAIVVVLLAGALGWLGLGQTIRESDQASLLLGALNLSRDWQPSGAGLYNYENQWFTYWILCGFGRLFDLLSDGGVEQFVGFFNTVALVICWGGVSAAVVFAAGRSWAGLAVASGVFLSPVWLMSLPLLSSNVISAGFLGLWIVAMEMGKGREGKLGWGIAVVSGALAFCAVGCRVDAAFVLPAWAVAWWGLGRGWVGMLRENRLWLSVVGAVAAVVIGRLLSAEASGSWSPFFHWKTFAGFTVFGLGGVAFWFVALFVMGIVGLVGRGSGRRDTWLKLVWVALLLFPVVFYARVLFSPRHFLTGALVVTLSGCFAGAEVMWANIFRSKARWLMFAGWASLVLPLVVGVRLQSLSAGKLTLGADATEFPTTDGNWVMGGYVHFLRRLSSASIRPIDHNQRVWGAWCRVPADAVGDESFNVVSAGLSSYGRLWATWHKKALQRDGGGLASRISDGEMVLFDDRSLTKKRMFSTRGKNNEPAPLSAVRNLSGASIVGEFQSARILKGGRDSSSTEGGELLARSGAISGLVKGNGMLFEPAAEWTKLLPRSSDEYIWIVVDVLGGEVGDPDWGEAREFNGVRYQVWEGSKPPNFVESISTMSAWVARSELPRFFNVSNY